MSANMTAERQPASGGGKTRTIDVGYLARVEGEGGLHVKIRGNKVTDVRFEIFEPPRFFEAFMRGRYFAEAPDITARICGICPVAYQMSSVNAMESAYGVSVGGQLRALRRLLYCGEWIESHALHVYMLHAPDFLGYSDAIKMAADYPQEVLRGLKMKKIGNEIMTIVGGREIHPINVRVGGFYRAPHISELMQLEEKLVWGRQAALDTVRWVAGLNFPHLERDYTFVALRHEQEYAITEGRLVSNRGLDIPVEEYEEHFKELHVAHSNALQSTLHGHSYFVGPLARYNLNYDKLPAFVREAAREAGLEPTCYNPFKSIIIRSLELLFAFDEALKIIEGYTVPEVPAIPVPPAGASAESYTGMGCTEAPRGILYHRYNLDKGGLITEARIIPPTSQNQQAMEEDLRDFVTARINMSKEELTWQCEQAVRNYDPCISCATHFLRLEIEHEEEG